MTQNYSISEIVQIGVQIEKNGRDFYNELITLTDNEEIVKVFSYLANEEDKHILAFQKMLDSIESFDQQESYPEEYYSHMCKLAEDHVFTKKDKGKEIASRIKEPVEAVNLGIQFEEESIALFEALKKIVSQENQEVIDVLITQEHKHLKDLSNLKDVLS